MSKKGGDPGQQLTVRWKDGRQPLSNHEYIRVDFRAPPGTLNRALEDLAVARAELWDAIGVEAFVVGAINRLTAVVRGLRRLILAAACSDRRPRDDQ